jgi:acetyltransferase-like isoleucine patch superfamily enzyme
VLLCIPPLNIIKQTADTQTPVTFRILMLQKILGFNKKAYWPVHFTSKINSPENIYCGIETCPGYMPGCYIQGFNGIYIGDYTQIGPNVGIISSNHNIYENRKGEQENAIRIGKYCWIGMNSVILPGVELGDFTVVAAGSIVTKSFSHGYVTIAGIPAKEIKRLDPDKCIRYESAIKFNGYIKHELFESYRLKKLKI